VLERCLREFILTIESNNIIIPYRGNNIGKLINDLSRSSYKWNTRGDYSGRPWLY